MPALLGAGIVPGQTGRLEVVRELLGNVRFGSKADMGLPLIDVRLPPKADIGSTYQDVRFVPEADSCTAAINTKLSNRPWFVVHNGLQLANVYL